MASRNDSELETMIAPSLGADSRAEAPSAPDELFAGRYHILSLLGSGGMGSVYMARDTELDEVVALKMLRREMMSAPGVVELFRREVKLARKVTHPNVARTFDIGEANGARYLTMEYIEGTSLRNIMDDEPRSSFEAVAKFGTAICGGLHAAHSVGVVHRDLKPDNVLVAKDGRIVITDFGIARPAEPGNVSVTMGVVVGTPAYMSPEQVEARRDIDARVDIYALGILLYEALTGALPFNGDTALAVAAARLIHDAPDVRTLRPDTPTRLAEIVKRCVAKSRDARFSSAEEVSAALSSITDLTLDTQRLVLTHAPPEAKTIAVLPFRNSGAEEERHIVDGLWDDLIDSLSMTNGLRVRPRGAVAPFMATDQDPCVVGRSMGVEAVIEGSVRSTANGLRVSVRVLSVGDGFQLWARRFERPTRDLFTLSDEIASAVADVLTLERDVPNRAALEPSAMNLYLKGRHEFRKGFGTGTEAAVVLFREALAVAPNDPMVLAALATAQCRRWFFGKDNAFIEAVESATKAARLAPHLPEARHALALLDLHKGNYELSFHALIDVVKSSSHLPSHETLCGLYQEIGLLADARHHIDEALRIDPSSAFALFELGRFYALEGRWSAYDQVYNRLANHTDPQVRLDASRLLVRSALWRGDIEGARRGIGDADLGPISQELSSLLVNPGSDPKDVRAAFDATRKIGASLRRVALMYQIEMEYAGFNKDTTWGMETLRASANSALVDEIWLDKCPLLVALRGAPGFEEAAVPIRRRAAVLRAFVAKERPLRS